MKAVWRRSYQSRGGATLVMIVVLCSLLVGCGTAPTTSTPTAEGGIYDPSPGAVLIQIGRSGGLRPPPLSYDLNLPSYTLFGNGIAYSSGGDLGVGKNQFTAEQVEQLMSAIQATGILTAEEKPDQPKCADTDGVDDYYQINLRRGSKNFRYCSYLDEFKVPLRETAELIGQTQGQAVGIEYKPERMLLIVYHLKQLPEDVEAETWPVATIDLLKVAPPDGKEGEVNVSYRRTYADSQEHRFDAEGAAAEEVYIKVRTGEMGKIYQQGMDYFAVGVRPYWPSEGR